MNIWNGHCMYCEAVIDYDPTTGRWLAYVTGNRILCRADISPKYHALDLARERLYDSA